MEWSMKNKFPYNIFFPEMPTYFAINAIQTPFTVWSVWTFVYMGRRAGIPSSIILSMLLRIYVLQIFSDLLIQFRVTGHIDLESIFYNGAFWLKVSPNETKFVMSKNINQSELCPILSLKGK